MRKTVIAALLLSLSACGYSSLDSEMMGQVKKVDHSNPIICPAYYRVDISLGILRNGVGSMSTQDVWVTVDDKSHLDVLKAAAASGDLVKVTYDERRVVLCTEEKIVTKVEIVK
jgi:hypothetical protein